MSRAAGVPPEVDTLVARAAGTILASSRGRDEADALLREAATRLRATGARRSPYQARRAVMLHLRARHPERAYYMLKPEPHLGPRDAPPAPRSDTRFRHWLRRPDDYWHDPVYQALLALPPGDLPDGAMLPLCPLTRVAIQGLLRGDEDGEPVATLLARYGPRLYPAAVEYLSHPDRYGWDASVHSNAANNRWFAPGAGHVILAVAGGWPDDAAAPLFRLAFEAGWNYAGASLPDRPWARAMLDAFADGPYGPPDPPRWPRGAYTS